jgi:hypothetical protein
MGFTTQLRSSSGRTLLLFGLFVSLCSHSALGQGFAPGLRDSAALRPSTSTPDRQNAQQQLGTIAGKVVDQSGVSIEGVVVTLKHEGTSAGVDTLTNGDGLFSFTSVAPGPFQLTVKYPGLTPLEFSGALEPSQALTTPVMMLKIATVVTEVHVELTPEQVETAQVKEEEKQRVFGIVPNFYAVYDAHPVPISTKHKFELAWKSTRDPITILSAGALAGISQASNRWGGYGQGASGYAKRFGAAYGDAAIGTYLGGAVLPTLLKQDPRYYYQGTGSKGSRLLHALVSSVVTHGDNGALQVNYSNIVGNLGAGAFANLYYPPGDRHGARTVFSTGLLRLGETAVANVFEEFLAPKKVRARGAGKLAGQE